MAFQEKQLGQLRPADTNAASIYAPANGVTAVIKNIVVCNTTSSSVTFRIFHDDEGSTYDESTALVFDCTLLPNETKSFDGFKASATFGGNIGVRSSTGNAINFTLYGAEIQ